MNGTDATTGKPLSGIDHLRQSIADILRTPIGTRVQRRDYGSRLFELLDAPTNQSTLIDMYAATAEALATWEPRISVTKVSVESVSEGQLIIGLEGDYLPSGKPVTLSGIVVN